MSNKTAAELLAELQSDPNFVKMDKAREKSIQSQEERLSREESPIINDLSNAGIIVNSVWDLVNRPTSDKKIISILIKHLENIPPAKYSVKTREGIVRALTTPKGRGLAGPALVRLFPIEKDDNLRWVIGNALSLVATEEDLPTILDYLSNTRYGHAREMLICAVVRILGEKSVPFIEPFLEDDQLLAQTIVSLGDLRAESAREKIKPFTSHADSYIRKKAKEALKKIKK